MGARGGNATACEGICEDICIIGKVEGLTEGGGFLFPLSVRSESVRADERRAYSLRNW